MQWTFIIIYITCRSNGLQCSRYMVSSTDNKYLLLIVTKWLLTTIEAIGRKIRFYVHVKTYRDHFAKKASSIQQQKNVASRYFWMKIHLYKLYSMIIYRSICSVYREDNKMIHTIYEIALNRYNVPAGT